MSDFKNVVSTVKSTEEQLNMAEPYLLASETKLLLQVRSDLDEDEGFRPFAYADPLTPLYERYKHLGKWGHEPARSFLPPDTDLTTGSPWTVGHGDTVGVTPDSTRTKEQSFRRMEQKILEIHQSLSKILTWYKDSSFVTKTVLINMAYQMGVKGLLKFKNTLGYIAAKNYKQAAAGMSRSLWAKQTPRRAQKYCRRMETQTIPSNQQAPEKI